MYVCSVDWPLTFVYRLFLDLKIHQIIFSSSNLRLKITTMNFVQIFIVNFVQISKVVDLAKWGQSSHLMRWGGFVMCTSAKLKQNFGSNRLIIYVNYVEVYLG